MMWRKESRSNNEEGHLLLAGQIISRLVRFSEIVSRRREILTTLVNTIEMGDLIVLLALGWLTTPVVHVIYTFYHAQCNEKKDIGSIIKKPVKDQRLSDDDVHDESFVKVSQENVDSFFTSTPFYLANLATEVFQRACLVYFIDCLVIVADIIDPRLEIAHHELSLKFAKILYSFWAATRLMAFKRYLLCMAAKRPETKLGKVGLYDRILDLLILFCLILAILDILHVEVGPGLASLFAFGGVGTLVLTLASKDLAHQLVSGVVVSTSENFYVGDHIRLGNDTRGAIDYIGWLYTDVRGYDEITTRIPNEQFANRRICNISRHNRCQVKQLLRIKHSDYKKIPDFCSDVLKEIRLQCPEVISDGSRPFRAFLKDIKCDHLSVLVDARFCLPAIGKRYDNNRNKVLMIICEVLERHDITLAKPAVLTGNLDEGQATTLLDD